MNGLIDLNKGNTSIEDTQLNDTLSLEEANVVKQIVEQQDVNQLKDLVALFNATQVKKNTLRVRKLNDLFDKVSDQMAERFEKRPGEFSNKDLLDYMTATQGAIDKAQKNVNLVDNNTPITLNQNNQQININVQEETLNRESRERILNAVSALLGKINKDIPTEEDIIDVGREEESDN